jgi:hypothetical protein
MLKFLVAGLVLAGATQAYAVPVPPTAQKVAVYNCPQPVGHDAGCKVHPRTAHR